MYNLQVIQFNKGATFGKVQHIGYSFMSEELVIKKINDLTRLDESVNNIELFQLLKTNTSHSVVVNGIVITFILNVE